MTFALRAISAHFRAPSLIPSTVSIQRRTLPPVWTLQRNLGTFTDKILYLLTGMKRLNPEEAKQAIVDHQKLWVAHYAINNHNRAHRYYEMFYSMQLFKHPKNFEIQKRYTDLVDKNKEELTQEEVQSLVDLFQFAIASNDDFIAVVPLQYKLAEYRALIRI